MLAAPPPERPKPGGAGLRAGSVRRVLLAALGVGVLALAMVAVTGNPAHGHPAGDRSATTPTAPRAGYRWPLPGDPTVVRRFDPPPQPWLPGHRGVDLAGTPGEPVLAAGPGRVSFAGPVAGTAVISIRHPGGLRTTYQPVRATVRVGAQVDAGDQIGILLAGHPGCPSSACLHWGLRQGDTYLDPLALLGLGRVRLLPSDDLDQ